MLTQNLGYPRIGSHRELKKICESYWAGTTGLKSVLQVGKNIRRENWLIQKNAGIDLIPSNDFSFYDHVLDHSFMFGAIPERYQEIMLKKENAELDLYFAMARGYQKAGLDLAAMEMTKWFDTNYHYIVPEFKKNQQFKLFSTKIIDEFYESREMGIMTKPVLMGPVSYLLLGKEKDKGFERLDLLKNLLPVYVDILERLEALNVGWIQFDEPFLAMDLNEKEHEAFRFAYNFLHRKFPSIKIILTTYFECLGNNSILATSLPVDALHIDLVKSPNQLEEIFKNLNSKMILSLGLIDGRNVWKNDFKKTLSTIGNAIEKIGADRVWIATSCSLIHTPCDLENETNEEVLSPQIKDWLAFAKQKLDELKVLKNLASGDSNAELQKLLSANISAQKSRDDSPLIHDSAVRNNISKIEAGYDTRMSSFQTRKTKQSKILKLPVFPTTTIGSFPQTKEVRSWRAQLKNGKISEKEYTELLEQEIKKTVIWQEEIGLDVLVHGEFERNDMVEYFGEQLSGFAFTQHAWVQSYGSRCVKPPIIYGDVSRPLAMTVKWSSFAQSLTSRWMKGMLTGPVTILQWSFVRNDQPCSETCTQIALAIREEVCDLERAGIRIIQIDEPAIREGLPLRKKDWDTYLEWAVKAFRIAVSGVKDETQIHTHMCYSEFNDIIKSIAAMDADVITIETSRSQMELLDVFADFKYPNEIGPGVYDIHSPRLPGKDEMVGLLKKAATVIPEDQLWVNPDCGLKTRGWDETKKALIEMVNAARKMREAAAERTVNLP